MKLPHQTCFLQITVVFLKRSLSQNHASKSVTHFPKWHFHNLATTFQYVHNPLSELLSSLHYACQYVLRNPRLAVDLCRTSGTETNPTTFMVRGEQKDLSY